MHLKSRFRNSILLLAFVPLAGCLFRRHDVVIPVSTATLQEATRQQLIATVNTMASRVQSFAASVDIDSTLTRQKKGKANQYQVTDYPEISGYVLVREPDMLRMKGLAPVVRSTLFDMVSNGKTFALSIPPQNKFVVGSNTMGKPSSQSLENLRPQAVMDALLLKEIDLQNERAVLEESTETVKDPKTHKPEQQPDYEIIVIRKEGDDWYLSRKIIFSRVDLLPHRQLIYDVQGRLATNARYDNFTQYGNVLFPSIVQIERPIENYSIQLSITKLTLNEPLKDEQFTLNQPPGSKLINLDQKNGNTAELNEQPAKEAPKQME